MNQGTWTQHMMSQLTSGEHGLHSMGRIQDTYPKKSILQTQLLVYTHKINSCFCGPLAKKFYCSLYRGSLNHPAYNEVFKEKNMWVGKLLIYKSGDLVLGDSCNGNRCNWVCRCWFLSATRNCAKSSIWPTLGSLGKLVGEFSLRYLLYVGRGNKAIHKHCDI